MDMLDHALDPSGQDKTDDTASDDGVQLVHGTSDGEALVAVNVDGVDTGEEQQTAIASVAGQGTISLDPAVQYQFRTDTGQVTYRVVQVAQDGSEQPQVVTTGFPATTQSDVPLQAVIQSPFSNGGSPAEEALGETRFTYVPAVTAAGDGTVTTTDGGASALGQVSAAGGQFYVMMSPQDVLQGQRNIAPRTGSFSPKVEGARTGRDDRRRATHNEVERRRRDKINNWIVQLSKLVPDCAQDHTKQGQVVSNSSKGGILAKACDYITELRTANARMAESLKETERLSVDAELLRQQCEELKQENVVLRAQLQQHGIVIADLTGATT